MQAAHAARLGKYASPMAMLAMEAQGIGPTALPGLLTTARAGSGGWKGDDESDYGDGPLAHAPDADSDDDDLSSLASDDLEHMAYDDLQRKLARNDAREKRMLAKMAADGGGTLVDSAAEAEAADVRQQEFFAVAQSKRGKEVQIEELAARREKEKQALPVALSLFLTVTEPYP